MYMKKSSQKKLNIESTMWILLYVIVPVGTPEETYRVTVHMWTLEDTCTYSYSSQVNNRRKMYAEILFQSEQVYKITFPLKIKYTYQHRLPLWTIKVTYTR